MQKRTFIAYKGAKLTVEWYFSELGKSVALEYYNELPMAQQGKLFYLIQVMADTGKIHNREKFNNEDDQIFAFKPAPDRFLCFFFEGAKIIITNAYKKQTQKMPAREKDRALKIKKDYIKRYKEGTYYE